MEHSIALLTDRQIHKQRWEEATGGLFECVVLDPSLLDEAAHADAVVVDARCQPGEDGVLTAVACLRAANSPTVVDAIGVEDAIEDTIEELCGGLVARSEGDLGRIVQALIRRTDPRRAHRFEFLTVSPTSNDLVAVYGDGRAQWISRPLGKDDDHSEITDIRFSEDAASAFIEFESGANTHLEASPPPQSDGVAVSGSLESEDLGARLKALRLAAGLTQAELARRTGIHRPNIARVEAGRHTPSLETLSRIAHAIGVPASRVFNKERPGS